MNSSIISKRTFVLTVLILSAGLCGVVFADNQVKLDAALSKPYVLSDSEQAIYLKVALTGFEMENQSDRPPANIALVIDKSGSMTGRKIEHAKEGALLALEHMAKNDILSVVVYESDVEVLIPATKLTNRQWIENQIRKIKAGGSTALYGGVTEASKQLRKFKDDEHISRMILLSDGLANVGPSSPAALGELGLSLAKEGIAITTIGLGTGYNEDLMSRLALQSDGGHYFAERPEELKGVFEDELGRALSVVAQEVEVDITVGEGFKPVRILGRQGSIDGRNVKVVINQLYSEHERYFILELKAPSEADGKINEAASVKVAYDNLKTQTRDRLTSVVDVHYTDSEEMVASHINKDVMADVTEQLAVEKQEWAIHLRDQGDYSKAQQILHQNALELRSAGSAYDSKELEDYAVQNEMQASEVRDEEAWTRNRKSMRSDQTRRKGQR